MSWDGHTRRSRLPKDWPTRVRKVKARAKGRCEYAVHVPECDGIGTECDHIEQGDDHSLTNLQWLSEPCHAHKTRLDNQAGKRLAIPAERHPIADLLDR